MVYGDLLFLLNFVLDYGLLLATAKIADAPFVRLRLLGSAAVGAAYAVLIFVPGLQWLAALPLRILSGCLLLLIAFGGERRFWRILAVFAAVTAALGGGVLALTNLGDATFYRGVPTSGADLWAVLLAGSLVCGGLAFLFRRGAGQTGQRFVRVEVHNAGRSVCFRALVDTGNTLTDRNQRRAIVADSGVFCDLLGLNPSDIALPSQGFQKLAQSLPPGRVQLLPYRTVGLEDGLMLAVRPDRITVDGVERRGLLLAGAAHPVSDSGDYQGLMGSDVMEGSL